MRHLVLFALGLISAPALALVNVDLYQTEVVLDQSIEKPDAQARVEGMKEVIVRASGDQTATNNSVVKKALGQSAQYLSQISYGQQGEQQTLQMVFNSSQIQSLLNQAQLATWPSERANVLVWLIEEAQSDRSIAWQYSDSALLTQMKDEAQSRGLPLTVPVGDFADVTGVNIADFWGGFARPVGEASERYPADAVLVIRARGNDLRWTLYDQKPATIGITRQAPLTGSHNGANSAEKMINDISDYYAKNSAVVVSSESSESVKVRFTSLDNATDFFIVERKLKQLSSVASVDILDIRGAEVTFKVHLLSSKEAFEQAVARLDETTPMPAQYDDKKVVELMPVEMPVNTTAETTEGAIVVNDPQPIAEPEVIMGEPTLVFEWQSQAYTPEPQETVEAQPEVIEPDTDTNTEF